MSGTIAISSSHAKQISWPQKSTLEIAMCRTIFIVLVVPGFVLFIGKYLNQRLQLYFLKSLILIQIAEHFLVLFTSTIESYV